MFDHNKLSMQYIDWMAESSFKCGLCSWNPAGQELVQPQFRTNAPILEKLKQHTISMTIFSWVCNE